MWYKEEEKEEGEGEEEEEAEEKVTVREKKNFCVCLYASSRVHSNHRLLLVYLFRPSLYHTIESPREKICSSNESVHINLILQHHDDAPPSLFLPPSTRLDDDDDDANDEQSCSRVSIFQKRQRG